MTEIIVDGEKTKKSEDSLGRDKLAERIANGISNFDTSGRGLVVAIYGPWGSGKTSFKNFVIESLKEKGLIDEAKKLGKKIKNQKKPYPFRVHHYNPWHWVSDSTDSLSLGFCTEIATAIGKAEIYGERKAALRLNAMNHLVRYGGHLAKLAGAGVAFAGNPALGIPVAIFGATLEGMGNEGEGSTKLMTEWVEAFESGLEKQREMLVNEMKQLKRRILVVIDDIDRLSSREIQLLFSMLKFQADLPNMTILLMCQQDIVETSLGELFPSSDKSYGKLFLDKIVHFGFNLPYISSSTIQEELRKNLRVSAQTLNYIVTFFESYRDVYRFMNGYRFVEAVLSNERGLFVDENDLASLEVVRHFYPDLHKFISENRTDVVSNNTRSLRNKAEKRYFADLEDRKSMAWRKLVFEVIPEVLPDDTKRIISRAAFDAYFSLFSQDE